MNIKELREMSLESRFKAVCDAAEAEVRGRKVLMSQDHVLALIDIKDLGFWMMGKGCFSEAVLDNFKEFQPTESNVLCRRLGETVIQDRYVKQVLRVIAPGADKRTKGSIGVLVDLKQNFPTVIKADSEQAVIVAPFIAV